MTANFIKTLRLKLAATAVAAAAVFASAPAQAEPRVGVDWSKVVYDLDQYVRGNTGGTTMLAPAQAPQLRVSNRWSGSEDMNAIHKHQLEQHWFGVAPRLSLIARDWNGSLRLAGDRLSLTDSIRLSASTRMVVGRARLSPTRFTPFIQVGVGQWRIDRVYMPLSPVSEEIAGQLGGGFELRLAKHWKAAVEANCTSLIREGQTFQHNMLWSSFLASRVSF
jgi:hypothetical protein